MMEKIHTFDNGVSVYDAHLMPAQRERYKIKNVHEADEEDFFIKIMSAIPDAGCFVNIGTAVGYYALLAKKCSPALQIHAVEPLRYFRHCFQENIRLNNFADEDFIVHPVAVGAENGRVKQSHLADRSQMDR